MSERNSKDLLQLETNTILESNLLVCKESSLPEYPVQRPAMFPVPKSQESNKKLMAEAKDLMLGVVDLHKPEAVAAVESALAGNPPAFPLVESNSDSETNDSSDENEEDNDGKDETPSKSMANDEKHSSCMPTKKQNQKKRSMIIELP